MTILKRASSYVVLFGIPYGGVLWVALYNRIHPVLFGCPFFYWFQFLWIIVTAIITAFAYMVKV